MTTDPTKQTPVEIDTVLFENYQSQARIEANLKTVIARLERAEAVLVRHDTEQARQVVLESREAISALREARTDLIAESVPYEAEHIARRWNRYFLVTNGNGHVHRGLDCSTCFRTTEYAWLVSLADCDENAMIEEWGERACTVCFPTAPTNPLYHRPARIDREAREARDAEKAAKAAEKAEKAIFDVDGSPLKVDYTVLKTKVSARNALTSAFQSLVIYGTDHPQDFVSQIRKLVPALRAAIPTFDLDQVAGRAVAKAQKDSQVPANNPWRLTDEQILAHKATIRVNVAAARALVKDLEVTV